MTETDILSAILARITQLPSVLAWRNNSGMFFTATGRAVRASVPGAADIIGVCRGRFIALEVKTKTGRQKPSQRNFQEACERAGGIYAIVRSPDEAVAVLEDMQT